MIYILFAVLCSSAISVIMKISDRRGQSGYAILCINYLFASAVSLVLALRNETLTGITPAVILLGVITGIIFLAAFILNQLSINRNGAALSAAFMKMGILVPLFLSLFLWHESPSLVQIIGLILAVVAILVMTVHFDRKSVSIFRTFWVLPLLMVCAGAADSMSKFYTLYGVEKLNEWYMFLTFFTAFILCFPLMLRQGEHFNIPKLELGSVLGLANYASTWFLLLAIERLPGYFVYPMVNASVIVVVALVSIAFFSEKLKKHQFVGLILVLAAVVLLNL